MVQTTHTLTPISSPSATSSLDAMTDTGFRRFYAFYRAFQEQTNKDNNNLQSSVRLVNQ